MNIGGFPFLRDLQEKYRADERTRTALLLITSVLLAIWVRPKSLLAELQPYPPNASTEVKVNGLLVLEFARRCRKTHRANLLSL
jgi:hypothetical protein